MAASRAAAKWVHGLVIASSLALGGCSAVPDWANPVAWYDGVFGAPSTTAPKPASAASPQETAGKNGTDRTFPNLATPDRRNASSGSERQAVTEGLVADRTNARYLDDVARGRVDQPAATTGLKPAGLLLFDGDSLQPDLQGQALLRQLADRQKLSGGTVRIVAYGAGRSPAATPESVPRRRGQAVAAELVRRGVNPQNIVVEGAPAAGTQASTVAIFIDN